MVTEVILFFAILGAAFVLSSRELRVKQLDYRKKQYHPENTSWEAFSERWARLLTAGTRPHPYDPCINAIAITTSYWESIQTPKKSQNAK
jgi:hypothetical protein